MEQRTLFSTFISDSSTSSGSTLFIGGGGSSTLPTVYPPSIHELTPVGDSLYFATNGNRVWRSDGTAAGTQEVAKFDGDVGEFVDFAGTLFFAARKKEVGLELWRTDGTAAGTRLVTDVAGAGDLAPKQLTVIGRWMYFTSGDTLYRTDGTTNGTTSLGISAGAIKAVGDTLYFITGTELWKTDGTPTGAVRLSDSLPRNYSWTRVLTAGDGKLFALFRDQQTSTMALWSSDGTPGGTREVAIVRYDPSKNASGETEERWDDTAVLWGRMFFNGITSRGKHAVYVTDGTTAGTSVFALQTRPNAEPVELETVGGRLFFGRFTGLRGDEWWVSNGKASNTSLVTTHAPSTRAYESALIGFNDAAYFASVDSSPENLGNIVGRGIFRSDGTPKGTGVVLDNWLSSRHPKSAATRDAVFFTNDDASQLAAIDADGKATIISPMAPSATLDARDTVAAPGLTYTFTVSYRHHDPAAEGTFETFDDTNLYVTGPNGYAAYAKFVDVDWGSSGPRAASYTMQPPGGSWNNLDKGTYWVWMRDHGVKDGAGYVPAGPLGSFLVRPVTSEPGSISGTVFKDSDADGFVDVGELKHEGFRIWVDLNNDGRFQPNEPNARSGADGRYVIAGIPAGQYHVRQTPVEGWEFSTPDRVIRVLPGVDVEAHFDARYEPHSGSISGVVFYDTNGNGARNPKEGVLKGFTVYLERNFDGKLSDNDPRVVTGPDGGYAFTGLNAGSYRLRQVAAGGEWKMTTVSEVLITIGPGGADVANFGNVLAGTAQVSGVIRHELDADGQVNLGYEPGLGGRRVFSDANRNGLWDANEPSTFSDYSGSYLLKGLLAGTHRIVCAVPDAGWVSTTPAAAEVTLGVGGGAQQFFMQAQKSLIAGYVFDDRDRDGVAIKGEPLLAGWQVYMDENGNGRYDGGERIAMTDANGRYEFAGVFARKYSIGVTLAVDWAAISPSYVMLTPPVGGTGKLDFAVANRTQGVAWGGARRFDTTPSRPAPGVRVFDDLDGDGLWDGDELFTFTADSGLWTLGGLSAGAHTLRAEGSSTIRSVTIVGEQRQFVPSFMLH